MANYSIFSKILGLIKESVRGTAETTPTQWIAVAQDAEINYSTTIIPDMSLRGRNAEHAGAPGLKTGVGNLPMPARAHNIGAFLQMLIGDPSSAENAAFVVTLSTKTPDPLVIVIFFVLRLYVTV